MKKLDIVTLLVVARDAGVFTALGTTEAANNVLPPPQPGEMERLSKLLAHCIELGLTASAASARRLLDLEIKGGGFIHQREATWNELAGRLRDEMQSSMAMFVEPSKVHFFTEPRLFDTLTVKVSIRFPKAVRDIEEAGKCLALDRGTAAVFHLMRVLEVGLQELGTKLGIALVQDKTWQTILNNVNGAVKRLPQSTREEKEYLGKVSAVAAHLQNVKDAWRNDVMHPLESYTPDEALDVWTHTKALMVKLVPLV